VKNTLYCFIAIGLCLAVGKGLTALIGGLPASLYGMIMFTTCLHFSLIKAEKVQTSIVWIIKHMGVCFVPAGVGIINHFELIKHHGFALIGIIFLSTFVLLTFVGLTYQHFINNRQPTDNY
jgi:holin-like protein